MTCGLVLENAQNAVMPLTQDDVIFAWPETVTQEQKAIWSDALEAAKNAGMTMSLKAERLNGYSMPITLDMEILALARDLSLKNGHRNFIYLLDFCATNDFCFCETFTVQTLL